MKLRHAFVARGYDSFACTKCEWKSIDLKLKKNCKCYDIRFPPVIDGSKFQVQILLFQLFLSLHTHLYRLYDTFSKHLLQNIFCSCFEFLKSTFFTIICFFSLLFIHLFTFCSIFHSIFLFIYFFVPLL